MSFNKVLAAVLVFVFLIFTLTVIVTWSVESAVLTADAYVQALEEADFFDVPYQLIREGKIPTPGGLLLLEGPLSVVSGAELETIARELAPPEWLHAQLERAIRALVSLTEESQVDKLPDLVISLSEVKARAVGEPGGRALSVVISHLPTCPPGRTPLELSSATPVCKPAGADLSFVQQLQALLVPLVERVPDTYRVSWQPEERGVLEDLRQASQTIGQLRLMFVLLIVLNVALLGLVWLLAVRSPAEWLRWTGVPLLSLGVLTLLVALLVPEIVSWGLDNLALWADSDVPARLARALEVAIQEFAQLAFGPARSIGLVLVVVGLVLTLLSPLFPHQQAGKELPQ